MTLLQIENRAEARHVIVQIDENLRGIPANVMLYVSLKGVIGVIFNVIVLFFISLTGWEVVDSSKRKAALEVFTKEKPNDTTVL